MTVRPLGGPAGRALRAAAVLAALSAVAVAARADELTEPTDQAEPLTATASAEPAPAAPVSASIASAYDCKIEPSATVELSSEAVGVIDQVFVGRGARVAAGDLVAQLRSEIDRANAELAATKAADESAVEVKRAQETYERRRLERHRALIADRVVNAQEADEIRTAAQVARLERAVEENVREQAQLEKKRADALLASREVRSTVNGVVLSVDRDPGEYVNGEAIATIVRLDPLHVEVFAPIEVAKRLVEGDPAEVLSPNEAPVAATVDVIDRVADAASRTVKIRLTLPNPDYGVIAGQNCRARFPAIADR